MGHGFPTHRALVISLVTVMMVWPACFATTQMYSVEYIRSSDSFRLSSGGLSSDAVAWGYYERDGNLTGWNKLYVRAQSGSWPPSVVGRAAGYLEGRLTHEDISDVLLTYDLNFQSFWKQFPHVRDAMEHWLHQWSDWVHAQTQANPKDTYWRHVGLILSQVKGLSEGYNDAQTNASNHRTVFQFLQFSSGADMMDVMQSLLSPKQRTPWFNMSDDAVQLASAMNSHCSALIKLLPGGGNGAPPADVFMGHTTWNQYIGMLRVYKRYDIRLEPDAPSLMSFSSYPAFLYSGDDFYVMRDSNILSMETTLDVYNASLYRLLTPKCVLTWVRGMVANRIATNGEQWVQTFAMHNSGTYNNQWMVVDLGKLGDSSDFLWIAEQMPGYVGVQDVTPVIQEQGYWPSYNIPYSRKIYEAMGYQAMANQYGAPYTYDSAPRANIFRRDAPNISSMGHMREMMRYNDYLHDPLSLGNPGYAVASRFDLAKPANASAPVGGIDSKVTSRGAWETRAAVYAINGPTRVDVPTFDWTKDNRWGTPHVGQPEVFEFNWEEMRTPASPER